MYFQDNHRTLYNKPCNDMSEIPDNTVQCVVTSPPYWGLRKYAGEQDLIWGGDSECEHEWGKQKIVKVGRNDTGDIYEADGMPRPFGGQKAEDTILGSYCSICGAWRGAYGLEPTPELYVEHTIEILREIRRVLRKDGVVFWNVGDSYFGGGNGYGSPVTGKQATNIGTTDDDLREMHYKVQNAKHQTLKPKDLCLIPFRVAIAAQQDGWWIRSVIIWNKPNPMPESVKDRPTDAYEHILMLTKSARYYWDIEAVREQQNPNSLERLKRGWNGNGERGYPGGVQNHIKNYMGKSQEEIDLLPGRNLRNVWTFPTQPYPEAHFATFPEELPERCIKAASKEGDTILDPFAGSGTTMKVAAELNRKAIGYEISEEYCELIVDRNNQQVLL